jgi:hypothetical protein
MRYKNRTFRFIVFIFLCFRVVSYSQTTEEYAPFLLKGIVTSDKKPLVGVLFELTKAEKIITSFTTTANGKFNIKIEQNPVDKNSYYNLVISKPGYVTKTLSVNTYIPETQYDDNTFVYTLDVSLVATKVSEVVIKRPYGKIKWDNELNMYTLDQSYYQSIAREEKLLEQNPDQYLLEFAAKKRKEEEEALQRKKQAEKEKAMTAAEANLQAMEAAALKRRTKMMIDSLEALKKEQSVVQQQPSSEQQPQQVVESKKEDTPEIIKPPTNYKDTTIFNGAMHYSVNQERAKIQSVKRKMEKSKAENLSVKYETKNMSTSLLDAVDAYDKKMKRK